MLAEAARAAFVDVFNGFSIERLKRIPHGITWAENVNSMELQFEARVLETKHNAMHFSVEVTYSPTAVASYTENIPVQTARYDNIVKLGGMTKE